MDWAEVCVEFRSAIRAALENGMTIQEIQDQVDEEQSEREAEG